MEFYDTICLSFDVDWAPEFMLEELYNTLAPLALPFTLCCTHSSPMVQKLLALPFCECALHPNFEDADNESKVLEDLHLTFPQAKGIRNHRLFYHSGLLKLFHEAQLIYFSNDLMFQKNGLEPYYDWSGMIRLPIFWEDDVHAALYPGDFGLSKVDIKSNGLKIFNFHPVHLYLNTSSMDNYYNCKSKFHNEDQISKHRQHSNGCKTFLNELLSSIKSKQIMSLLEAANKFESTNPKPKEYESFLVNMASGKTNKNEM